MEHRSCSSVLSYQGQEVVMQFDGLSTPKALANSSPGLIQPWVKSSTKVLNSEGVPMQTEHFQCLLISWLDYPQGCFNPGLELANAFGVLRPSNCITTYRYYRHKKGSGNSYCSLQLHD